MDIDRRRNLPELQSGGQQALLLMGMNRLACADFADYAGLDPCSADSHREVRDDVIRNFLSRPFVHFRWMRIVRVVPATGDDMQSRCERGIRMVENRPVEFSDLEYLSETRIKKSKRIL